MYNEIYADEIKALGKQVLKYHKHRRKVARAQWKQPYNIHRNITVFTDGTVLDDTLLSIISKRGECTRQVVDVFGVGNFIELVDEEGESLYSNVSLDEFKEQEYENSAFILVIDSQKHDKRWNDIIKLCAQKAKNSADNKVLVAMLAPAVRAIPDGVEKLQEREYSFFLEKMVTDHTDAERFLIGIEAECRSAMSMLEGAQMTYLRYDNVFGLDGLAFPAYDLQGMVKRAFEEGEVTITKEDRLFKLSCMYVKDAVMCLMAGLNYGKHGHVYNVTRYSVTVADFKERLQKLFPEKIALKTDGLTYSIDEVCSHNLSALKFFHEQSKLSGFMKSFGSAYYLCVCCWMDIPFDVISRLSCYEGKLDRLKSAEIDILKEIDRICRKHNIQYFLAGGSCLGAIRDNKSIPWDDDLDIGMLREEFEKFRKVAPQELGEKYVYSSPDHDENCHYYFDKIRLKDTYFSTFYSNKFVFEDGVFVDIVVYDQTTKNSFFRKIQIKLISAMVKLIRLRWYGYPIGRGKRKKLAKRILPIMNLIPFKSYHKWYERFAAHYKKLRNAEYVLDGGTHLTKSPFLRESISDVEYTEFDGMKEAPIPAGYHEYLTFLYGENYRPAPGLSSRLAAHKIARLDLGKYLFENDPKQTFRAVDIRGELFESEDER